MMLKYAVVIFWSDEDDLYLAYAPELPGCMAHGDTQEEALNSIQEAMALWLDVAREFKDWVPEPKVREIIFDIHAEMPESPVETGA